VFAVVTVFSTVYSRKYNWQLYLKDSQLEGEVYVVGIHGRSTVQRGFWAGSPSRLLCSLSWDSWRWWLPEIQPVITLYSNKHLCTISRHGKFLCYSLNPWSFVCAHMPQETT